ncbi:SO2930 family diheme c-type cytochrome [Portibacter marinus]|uniref:SO2930 family diheme c-type cytochrome n=1 Tax=Portibacter marinus TaxID=2898660 RepID=UPI001F3C4DA3|nr:SO2930 family diheme c-type cytochrome [Portibacter marinus]
MSAFRNKIIGVLLLATLLFMYEACAPAKADGISIPNQGVFFDQISEYGILGHDQEPHPKLVRYEVTNELFTDYAMKDRYVYMPAGKQAKLKADGFFEWPEGAMLVKNFGYSKEQIGSDQLIETRLLIKEADSWKAVSYKWDEKQRDAKITKVGDIIKLNLHNESFDYVIPNKNQCKSCHNHNESIDPLGFKYANLGGVDGQLQRLEGKGIITVADIVPQGKTMISYRDVNQPIQDRALAYLDINCGHCHRPEGPGNTSGLYLQYDETRTNHLGFCKAPVAAGKGSGGRQFDILPGSADSSILYHRMASLDPGVMMPEVGRSLVHQEGLKIVGAWINGLKDENCN